MMTDDFVNAQLIDISKRLGVLQGTMEAVLKEGQKTNGRTSRLEDDVVYMKPIVQDYANVRMKVLIGLFTLLAVGYAGGAGAGDIVAKVISEIVK